MPWAEIIAANTDLIARVQTALTIAAWAQWVVGFWCVSLWLGMKAGDAVTAWELRR